MTTSKILVPAGANLDGTKDRVPVDIEIPQPLHVVIDGSGGGDSKSLSIDLSSIITNNGVKAFDVDSISVGFYPDDTFESPTSGAILGPVQNADIEDFVFILQPSGIFAVNLQLSNVTISDPASTHGEINVEYVNSSAETTTYPHSVEWIDGGDSSHWGVTFAFNADVIPSDAIGCTVTFWGGIH